MTKHLWTVFLAALLVFGVNADASAEDYTWCSSGPGACGQPSPAVACQVAFASLGSGVKFTHTIKKDETTHSCHGTRTADDSPFAQWTAGRAGNGCAAPKVYNAATGVCAIPNLPSCKAGEDWNLSTFGSGPPGSHGGCTVKCDKVLACHAKDGKVYCMYACKRTGENTPPDAPPSPPAVDAPPNLSDAPRVPTPEPQPPTPSGGCPAGTVQIGSRADGGPICIGGGTNPDNGPGGAGGSGGGTTTTTPTVTAPTPDGGSTKTDTISRTNSDGSVTTTTTVQTTAPDGKVTTQVSGATTAGATGQPGTSDLAAKDKPFCTQNPTLAICRNSSVSGTCGEITCTGDAVACATLRQTALMQCRQKQNEDDMKAASSTVTGAAILAGNDPLKGALPDPKNAQVINMPGTVDASGWLGGGSCFSDKTITVQGHSVTIPFSNSCDILLVLRYALMVVAALVSYRMISGAVLT